MAPFKGPQPCIACCLGNFRDTRVWCIALMVRSQDTIDINLDIPFLRVYCVKKLFTLIVDGKKPRDQIWVRTDLRVGRHSLVVGATVTATATATRLVTAPFGRSGRKIISYLGLVLCYAFTKVRFFSISTVSLVIIVKSIVPKKFLHTIRWESRYLMVRTSLQRFCKRQVFSWFLICSMYILWFDRLGT